MIRSKYKRCYYTYVSKNPLNFVRFGYFQVVNLRNNKPKVVSWGIGHYNRNEEAVRELNPKRGRLMALNNVYNSFRVARGKKSYGGLYEAAIIKARDG